MNKRGEREKLTKMTLIAGNRIGKHRHRNKKKTLIRSPLLRKKPNYWLNLLVNLYNDLCMLMFLFCFFLTGELVNEATTNFQSILLLWSRANDVSPIVFHFDALNWFFLIFNWKYAKGIVTVNPKLLDRLVIRLASWYSVFTVLHYNFSRKNVLVSFITTNILLAMKIFESRLLAVDASGDENRIASNCSIALGKRLVCD